jgi:hypothetical protein
MIVPIVVFVAIQPFLPFPLLLFIMQSLFLRLLLDVFGIGGIRLDKLLTHFLTPVLLG